MKSENLIGGLQKEMNRVREIITVYDEIPNNAGVFASLMMKESIKNAEKQIASGDTIEMIKAFHDLQGYDY